MSDRVTELEAEVERLKVDIEIRDDYVKSVREDIREAWKQRDELVASAECLIKAMTGTQAETDFAFQMCMLEDSLASVKESK